MSSTVVDTRLTAITQMAQELVRIPSQGGIDDYEPAVECMTSWLTRAGLDGRVLRQDGRPVAVTATIDSGRPGPHIVLDGCLDTAAAGDPSSWERAPFTGDVVDGWLYGRGAADSKTALATYAWLLADLAEQGGFTGRLSLLADLDEHTGGFAGIQRWLAQAGRVDGVIVGYPGPDHIVVGGRGFWRARITVHGQAAHTGSSRDAGMSAVDRAIVLSQMLTGNLPGDVDPEFGLPPKLSITSLVAGAPGVWSVVPDRAELEVDVRTTPSFSGGAAAGYVQSICGDLDTLDGAARDTVVERLTQPWPAFRLPDGHALPTALLAGAREAGLSPVLKVAGPSNIGCLLADRGIPATAGFGTAYQGLHGADEAVDLGTLPAVYAAHRSAVLQLLV